MTQTTPPARNDESIRHAVLEAVHKADRSFNAAKLVVEEIDELSPQKIPHKVVGRMIRNSGFIGVWNRTAKEAKDIPYELELATRLLFVHDSEQVARALVIAWWRKHNIRYDTWGLIGVIDRAMEITADYRATYREQRQEEKDTVYYTKTKQRIVEVLRTASGTPLEITAAMQTAGFNVNRKQVGKQLQRMRDAKNGPRVQVNEYGAYSLIETEDGKAAAL